MTSSSEPTSPQNSGLRDRAAIVLGLLGLVSGVASAWFGYRIEIDWLQRIARVFFLQSGVLPIGVFFGLAMGLGAWLLQRRAGTALLAFIATIYAWSGALHIAIRLQRNADDDVHLIAASLAAGAFGAGLTHVGLSGALPSLRRVGAVAITALVGAVFGLLFYAGERHWVDPRALFLLWQPAVAFAMGLSAAARRGS